MPKPQLIITQLKIKNVIFVLLKGLLTIYSGPSKVRLSYMPLYSIINI